MGRGACVISQNRAILFGKALDTLKITGEGRELLQRSLLELNPSNEQMAELLVLCHTNYLAGIFAKTFQQELRRAVDEQEIKMIYKLLIGGKNLFIEGFDNENLDDEEVERVEKIWKEDVNKTLKLLETQALEFPHSDLTIIIEAEEFDLNDIIVPLAHSIYENPRTKEPFSDEVIEELEERLSLELKLYS